NPSILPPWISAVSHAGSCPGGYAALVASSRTPGAAPLGSVLGPASQQAGPSVQVGFEPGAAVQYRPKYASKGWVSWMMTTRCSIFDRGTLGPRAESAGASTSTSLPASALSGVWVGGFDDVVLEHAAARSVVSPAESARMGPS